MTDVAAPAKPSRAQAQAQAKKKANVAIAALVNAALADAEVAVELANKPKNTKAKKAAAVPVPVPASKVEAAGGLAAQSKGAGAPRNAPKPAKVDKAKEAKEVKADKAKVSKRVQPAPKQGGKVATLLVGGLKRRQMFSKDGRLVRAADTVPDQRARYIAAPYHLSRFEGDVDANTPGPIRIAKEEMNRICLRIARNAREYALNRRVKRASAQDVVHACALEGIILYLSFQKDDMEKESQKQTVKSVYAAMEKAKHARAIKQDQ